MKQSLRSLETVDVSIVIVSYNTKKLTLQCIKSIEEEGSEFKKEIIVVDNGSMDGSVDLLRKLRINLIENKDNLGFSKANNQGIKIVKGRFILLLNSDIIVKKGSIEKLVNFAEGENNIGAVVPRLLNTDGSIQASIFRLPTIIRAFKQYIFEQKGILDKYYPLGNEPVEVESAVMAAFMVTFKTISSVGYLDERFFMYFEDLDYCRRIGKMGLEIFYIPASEMIHYHGASGRKSDNNKTQSKRLVQSSRIYHGILRYSLITVMIWLSQKYNKFLAKII